MPRYFPFGMAEAAAAAAAETAVEAAAAAETAVEAAAAAASEAAAADDDDDDDEDDKDDDDVSSLDDEYAPMVQDERSFQKRVYWSEVKLNPTEELVKKYLNQHGYNFYPDTDDFESVSKWREEKVEMLARYEELAPQLDKFVWNSRSSNKLDLFSMLELVSDKIDLFSLVELNTIQRQIILDLRRSCKRKSLQLANIKPVIVLSEK